MAMVAEQRSRLGRQVRRATQVGVGLAADHAISPKALRVAARRVTQCRLSGVRVLPIPGC